MDCAIFDLPNKLIKTEENSRGFQFFDAGIRGVQLNEPQNSKCGRESGQEEPCRINEEQRHNGVASRETSGKV